MWLLLWIVGFELISGIIGYFSNPGSSSTSWYRNLIKSRLTPPGYVFGIVWPLLYLSLAILGWNLSFLPQFNEVYQYFWIQMILNWVWSPVFFNFHFIKLAFLIQLVLVVVNGNIVHMLWISNASNLALLICPYLCWLSFALYLITVINLYN